MIELSRTVRFFTPLVSGRGPSPIHPTPTLTPTPTPATPPPTSGLNGFGGIPPVDLNTLGRYDEIRVTCRGTPDAQTGYFKDIREIDRAVRTVALPIIAAAMQSPHSLESSPIRILSRITPALHEALSRSVVEIRWWLSPFYALSMGTDLSAASSLASPRAVIIRQRFEIAAAHRLHVDSYSDQENRKIFGRCNNPSGHGHNYVFEPAVELATDAPDGTFTTQVFESAVDQTILKPFDHTHLNVDTLEFNTTKGGVNPSVENIARVFFEKLAPLIQQSTKGHARLRAMTVFETEKTSATYPA